LVLLDYRLKGGLFLLRDYGRDVFIISTSMVPPFSAERPPKSWTSKDLKGEEFKDSDEANKRWKDRLVEMREG
jgi:hypothetical protein